MFKGKRLLNQIKYLGSQRNNLEENVELQMLSLIYALAMPHERFKIMLRFIKFEYENTGAQSINKLPKHMSASPFMNNYFHLETIERLCNIEYLKQKIGIKIF